MSTEIIIKSMAISHFKGIKKLEIDFIRETNIYGANGTFKSTVVDAFNWLLFGKNANGDSDSKFSVKTYDENGVTIPKIEHSIEAFLLINGHEVVIKKLLKESWVKKRGSLNTEFKGNKTEYFWDEVPLSKKEYQDKISDILNEDIFKLITDPLAFNNLHWEKARSILFQLSGNVSLDELELQRNNKKKLAAKRKKLVEQIKFIPSRIDEVSQNKPEPLDFEVLENEYSKYNKELSEIEVLISDRNKAQDKYSEKRQSLLNKIESLKSINSEIERSIYSENQKTKQKYSNHIATVNNEIDIINDQIKKATLKIESTNHEIDVANLLLQKHDNSIVSLREQWNNENSKEFIVNDAELKCPTCKQDLPKGDVDVKIKELEISFNSNKATKLSNINTIGEKTKLAITQIKKQLESYNSEIKELQNCIDFDYSRLQYLKSEIKKITKTNDSIKDIDIEETVQKAISSNSVYNENLKSIESLKAETETFKKVDVSDLIEKRNNLLSLNNSLQQKLFTKHEIEKADNRIKELEESEKSLALQINAIEKDEFTADEYIKSQIVLIEKNINSKFKFVKFKLFNQLINGGEEETCIALVNGVPFKEANTASRTNYGIDIINSLCKHFKVTAPIFIDNRESVTKLIETNSQVVNLIVSPKDKILRIEH